MTDIRFIGVDRKVFSAMIDLIEYLKGRGDKAGMLLFNRLLHILTGYFELCDHAVIENAQLKTSLIHTLECMDRGCKVCRDLQAAMMSPSLGSTPSTGGNDEKFSIN